MYIALMTTAVVFPVLEVATVKLADVAPAGIVTTPGSDITAVLLVNKETTMPPIGAPPLSTTVPMAVPPDLTRVGLNESPASVAAAGFTVSTADLLTPL